MQKVNASQCVHGSVCVQPHGLPLCHSVPACVHMRKDEGWAADLEDIIKDHGVGDVPEGALLGGRAGQVDQGPQDDAGAPVVEELQAGQRGRVRGCNRASKRSNKMQQSWHRRQTKL